MLVALTRAGSRVIIVVLTLLVAWAPAAARGPDAALSTIRRLAASPTVVEARLFTNVLQAEGLTEKSRERFVEFADATPGTWQTDPVTGEVRDAARLFIITRDGLGSVRLDSVATDVFVGLGERWRRTLIWTADERIELDSQTSKVAKRNLLEATDAKGFADQVDRGILPWDVSRSFDGGYFGCVEIATRILGQASDREATLAGGTGRISSESTGVFIEYDTSDFSVKTVRFPLPERAGFVTHRFMGRLAENSGVAHPGHWLIFRDDLGEATRVQTVAFLSVRPAGPEELEGAFDWKNLSELVMDKATGSVYRHDGAEDAEATGL